MVGRMGVNVRGGKEEMIREGGRRKVNWVKRGGVVGWMKRMGINRGGRVMVVEMRGKKIWLGG